MDQNASRPVNEHVGTLQVSGASQITTSIYPSPNTQLSLGGLTRAGHGVLNTYYCQVSVAGLTNGSTGTVAPWVTVINDWATVGANGQVTAFTGYVPDINAASATDNVRIRSDGIVTLAAPSTIGSLNLQSGGTYDPVLDLGGSNLGITTGGILNSTGIGTSIIQNGSLSTPSGEFVITTYSAPLTINANIVDSGSGTALTKAGGERLTLTGNNTYTGSTSIMRGTLIVSADANLGLGTSVYFDRATLQAAGSFASAKGLSTSSGGGTINTNGFDVEFSGPASGTLTKTGMGALTLDHAMTDNVTVSQGLLVLPNGAPSSTVNVSGGNVQSTGAIQSLNLGGGSVQSTGAIQALNLSRGSLQSTGPIQTVNLVGGTLQTEDATQSFSWTGGTLDIGGPAAATLTTAQFTFSGFFNPVQIDFGLGAAQSDHWSITQQFFVYSFAQPDTFQFEFQNLGGLTTGVDYSLIAFAPGASFPFGPPSASLFAIAPDLITEGWSGTFDVTSTGVFVNFSSVPEPGTTALLLLQGSVLLLAARRRIRGRNLPG